MLKQAIASFRYAHISLLCVGLMWVLPFLYWRHGLPLTTFYQEWGTAMLGVCAMPLLVTRRYWEQPEIPRIALLPIGLMLLTLAQFLLDRIDYFSQTLLLASYLLWAGLLVMLGQRLRVELGLPLLVTALAFCLLAGAEVSALIGFIQHFGWRGFFDRMVLLQTAGVVIGNMGQPNHYANYIALGLASLGLLYVRGLLRTWQAVLLALPLLFVLVLSGSRSAWFYLLFFCGLAYLWRRRDPENRLLLRYTLFLLLGFGLMHLAVQLPWLSGDKGSVTALERMTKGVADFSASGGEGGITQRSIRLHIWYEAWLIFTQFPLFGAGFGQFAWQHFLLGPSLHNVAIKGLYNNAHNIVMQTAAEMGLAGLSIWLGTLALWLRQLYRAPSTVYHWWGGGLLAVLALHSLLEYPLWYTYFIGLAALTLGALDGTTYRLELRNVGRLSVAAILLLGFLSLVQAWHGFRILEKLSYPQQASMSQAEFVDQLMQVHRQILLQPYAEMAVSNMMEGRVENLEAMRDLNESVMHFTPTRPVVYREAILLAMAGEIEEAKAQTERAIWAYPEGYPAFLQKLGAYAMKDPAHFSALLEFAPQVYEERERAVRSG